MSKTLKLKKPEPTLTAKPAEPGAEPPKEGEAGAAPAAEGEQQGIYIAGRHRNPLEAAAAQLAGREIPSLQLPDSHTPGYYAGMAQTRQKSQQ